VYKDDRRPTSRVRFVDLGLLVLGDGHETAPLPWPTHWASAAWTGFGTNVGPAGPSGHPQNDWSSDRFVIGPGSVFYDRGAVRRPAVAKINEFFTNHL
jgi:hypothetical protein